MGLVMDQSLSGEDRVCLVPSYKVDVRCDVRVTEDSFNGRTVRYRKPNCLAWPLVTAEDGPCFTL